VHSGSCQGHGYVSNPSHAVSRKECLFFQTRYDAQEGQHHALDMKSRRGVSINDKKISEETVLLGGDEILIGRTTPLFTEKNFEDGEGAQSHFKKVGERERPTTLDDSMSE
jgi:hypothetical protein